MPRPSDVFMPNWVLRYEGVQKRKNHHTPSVQNLPSTNAHVCLYLKHCHNGIFFSSLSDFCAAIISASSFLSCSMYSSSAALTNLLSRGGLYMNTQKPIHTKPITPMTTNAISQPQCFANSGMVSGATSAPMDAPALNMDVAKARSRLGKYSAVTFTAAGK